MRRFRILWSLLALGGAALAAAAQAPVVTAGGPFSNRDLRGDYLLSMVQIRNEFPPGSTTPVLNFCDVAGTISFDGAGTMTGSLVRRCSATGTVAEAVSLTYDVALDGSLLVIEPSEPADPTHGQIVDRGRSVLFDGTTRTNPNVLVFHGVATQR